MIKDTVTAIHRLEELYVKHFAELRNRIYDAYLAVDKANDVVNDDEKTIDSAVIEFNCIEAEKVLKEIRCLAVKLDSIRSTAKMLEKETF